MPDKQHIARRQVACQHVAEWLVWYERLQVARGRCKALVVYQSMGDSSLSGDTHVCGSATDWQYLGEGAVMDAREMGAPATWARWMRTATTASPTG